MVPPPESAAPPHHANGHANGHSNGCATSVSAAASAAGSAPAAAELSDGVFAWSDDAEPALRGVSLRLSAGELVCVVGKVGSGKSTLIHALLGELQPLRGRAVLRGEVAFCAQTAFIVNGAD